MSTLELIIAKSKKYIYGELLGNHNSKEIGDGYDFAQIRPYEYGENIRRVDPFATAKTGQLHVRNFYESRELNIHVVALMSGTLFFGTQIIKQEVLAQITSLLGLSAVKNADNFMLSLFSDTLLGRVGPTKKEAGVRRCVREVLSCATLGREIDYNKLEQYILYKIKKRSFIFLLGDFYDLPKLGVLARKHEVVVVRVRDHFELFPEALGELGIVDPSNKKQYDINLSAQNIKAYKKDLQKRDRAFKELLHSAGIRHIDIISQENIYHKFVSFFRTL